MAVETESTPDGVLVKLAGTLRCAYCHDPIAGVVECCASCSALVHADCRGEFGRCPTLGCTASSALSEGRPSTRQSPTSPLRRKLLPVLLAASCLGVCLLNTGFRGGVVPCFPDHKPPPRHVVAAKSLKDAAKLFRLEEHRWPSRVSELTDPQGRGPFLEPDEAFRGLRLVEHQGATWIACEVEVHPLFPDSLCLLQPLYR